MIKPQFRPKFHFSWTFKNGVQLLQLKTNLICFKNLKTLPAYSCRFYRRLQIRTILYVYSLKNKEYNLHMHEKLMFPLFFIFHLKYSKNFMVFNKIRCVYPTVHQLVKISAIMAFLLFCFTLFIKPILKSIRQICPCV